MREWKAEMKAEESTFNKNISRVMDERRDEIKAEDMLNELSPKKDIVNDYKIENEIVKSTIFVFLFFLVVFSAFTDPGDSSDSSSFYYSGDSSASSSFYYSGDSSASSSFYYSGDSSERYT